MRKDEGKSCDWCAHSRNSQYGRRGHNKRVRRNVRCEIEREDVRITRTRFTT